MSAETAMTTVSIYIVMVCVIALVMADLEYRDRRTQRKRDTGARDGFRCAAHQLGADRRDRQAIPERPADDPREQPDAAGDDAGAGRARDRPHEGKRGVVLPFTWGSHRGAGQ